MTPRQAVRRVRALEREIHRDLQGAVRRTLSAAKQEAKRLSSGPLSFADLARLDHPYARRHGSRGNTAVMPGKDPSVINVQTGAFKEAWQVDNPQGGDTTVSGRLFNLDEKADFLQYGTRFMVARPIPQRLEGFVRDRAEKEVATAAKRLERYYA